jgi:hypothetical protein
MSNNVTYMVQVESVVSWEAGRLHVSGSIGVLYRSEGLHITGVDSCRTS